VTEASKYEAEALMQKYSLKLIGGDNQLCRLRTILDVSNSDDILSTDVRRCSPTLRVSRYDSSLRRKAIKTSM